jgi:hypothetical protein
MIGVIALRLEYTDELQSILELLAERCPIVIKMIEDAELKHFGSCVLVRLAGPFVLSLHSPGIGASEA